MRTMNDGAPSNTRLETEIKRARPLLLLLIAY